MTAYDKLTLSTARFTIIIDMKSRTLNRFLPLFPYRVLLYMRHYMLDYSCFAHICHFGGQLR
jgi:hypothetical protein